MADCVGTWARVRGRLGAVSRSSKLRLRLGALIAIGLVVAAGRGHEPSVIGLAVVALGMGLRLWASGHLHKRETLAVSGPYRWVRHPLYLGTLIAIAGGFVLVKLYLLLPVALAIMMVVYLRRIGHEERDLRRHFGQSYDDYCARVPGLIPRLRPGLKGDGQRFSFRLALSNHWHHGMAAVVVAIVAMDLVEDLFYPWLSGRQSLGLAAREMLDFTALFRKGTF
jgi:hypothetical protein